MKPVFADTGFFLALVNPRDQYHQTAANLNATVAAPAPLVTTAWVLWNSPMPLQPVAAVESLALLWLDYDPNLTLKLSHRVRSCFDRGCELYTSRSDKEWSLTDCISFVVMKDHGLTDALTADRHFQQAGFKVLLSI